MRVTIQNIQNALEAYQKEKSIFTFREDLLIHKLQDFLNTLLSNPAYQNLTDEINSNDSFELCRLLLTYPATKSASLSLVDRLKEKI